MSGDCQVLPLTWTVKVPPDHQMLLTVQNISFSCPSLQLNIRDGVGRRDTLLYTVHVDTNVSVSVRSSDHVARLELVADTRWTNTTVCYAVMHLSVVIEGKTVSKVTWSLKQSLLARNLGIKKYIFLSPCQFVVLLLPPGHTKADK